MEPVVWTGIRNHQNSKCWHDTGGQQKTAKGHWNCLLQGWSAHLRTVAKRFDEMGIQSPEKTLIMSVSQSTQDWNAKLCSESYSLWKLKPTICAGAIAPTLQENFRWSLSWFLSQAAMQSETTHKKRSQKETLVDFQHQGLSAGFVSLGDCIQIHIQVWLLEWDEFTFFF